MFFEKFTKNLSGVPSFEPFRLRDKNPLGGTDKIRICWRPNEAMKAIHKRLIHYLRNLMVRLPYATGAKPGNSPRKNIMWHRKNRYFYLTDIQSAYKNVDGEKLAVVLCGLDSKLSGKENEVLAFLGQYCLSPQGGLIIGAPASPDLFNLYAGILIDRPMGELCERYGLTYTRYLDDLTFSSSMPIGKRKRKAIRKIIEVIGLKINHRKSAVYDLKKGPIVINGVGLEFGGRIFLPRHYLRKIRGIIHHAQTKGDISVNRVAGFMGVFFSTTRCGGLNRTEQKLVKKFRAFQQLTQI